MSPFATQLKFFRIERGFRQKELAELLGYEQSYVSALELGIKGPPTDEFVKQLISELKLSPEEQKALNDAVAASQKKLNIPTEAPVEIYWLLHKLRLQIEHLHPVQIELIETALNLPVSYNLPGISTSPRIRRRSQSNQEMEAKM